MKGGGKKFMQNGKFMIQSPSRMMQEIPERIWNELPLSFQHGGIMPYTGMAYLHKGEQIIPSNQTTMGNITININIDRKSVV